jgi:hypothetical protein
MPLIGLVSPDGLVKLIGHNGLVRLISLGLISFNGLSPKWHQLHQACWATTLALLAESPNQPCRPNKPHQFQRPCRPQWPCRFIGIGLSSLIGFISLFGHIGLVGRISHNSLTGIISLSLISLVGVLVHWPFKLATHGVLAIKLTSNTKISNTAI